MNYEWDYDSWNYIYDLLKLAMDIAKVFGTTNKELNELMDFISAQFFLICSKWKQAFVTDEIKFYC
ncbi:hypothetical protein [uncultured Eubacterium sp.]|uniref:hypothetical protein n=1 Tax=uncultured Eubacterium sp. TaxID=165185 RepID=UPI0025E1AAAC|nr:hypothetical protein [uncultured Eubacterium sp.]